jgi:RNA polymerase sigma-70 factor (ECF subfamily)
MTAWRKWDAVPDPAIGWLITTARYVIRNRTRTTLRQRALEERVALLESVAAQGGDLPADSRREALEQLARLTEEHREALLLVSWDGLTPDQAAEIVGIKPATFRKRLSRARHMLTGDASAPSSPSLQSHQTLTVATEAS